MNAPFPDKHKNAAIFQAIFEHAIDGILLADLKTRKFIMSNSSIRKMLGYNEEELNRLSVEDIHPKGDLPYILKQYNKQSRSEISVARNLPVMRKNGGIFYADIGASSITIGDRSFMMGFFREITRRTDAQNSLQDSYNKLEILNSISVEISSSLETDTIFKKAVALGAQLIGGDGGSLAIYDFEINVMSYRHHYNMPESLTRSLAKKGTGLAELTMKQGSIIIEDYPAHPRALKEFVDAGLKVLIAVPLASKGKNIGALGIFGFTQDKKFTTDDIKVLEAVGRQVGVAVENAMLYEKIKKEISETRRIEKNLRASEEKFRNLVETTSDWIWEIDADFRYTYASPRIKGLLGYEPEEVIGKTPFDLMLPDEAKKIMAEMSDIGRTKQPIASLKNWNRHKNGHNVLLETSAIPLFDVNNNLKGYRGIDRDITEKKRLEEQVLQKQKMEAIGTLAAGITHDFNNILSMIIGNTELAAKDIANDDPVKDKLEKVLTASFRARDVVRQLLHFCRKSIEDRKPLFPIPLIKESLKLIKASIPKTIKVIEDFPEKSLALLADQTQIHQVVINLCTNAVHAMTENGGILEISIDDLYLKKDALLFDPDLIPGDYILMSVSDTGHGIDPAVMERIFDPYFTTKGVDEGTGLGLSVVHGIVKSHGGGIQVMSTVGKGSNFRIYLPAIREDPKDVPQTTQNIPGGNERVLLIDDEEMLVELTKELLTALGYQVEGFNDPVKAVAAFLAEPDRFDLVITDMTMPKMTGDRVAEAILSIRPDIPILLCTGFNQKINAETALDMGITGYAEKPMDMKTLAEKVRSVIDRKMRK